MNTVSYIPEALDEDFEDSVFSKTKYLVNTCLSASILAETFAPSITLYCGLSSLTDTTIAVKKYLTTIQSYNN